MKRVTVVLAAIGLCIVAGALYAAVRQNQASRAADPFAVSPLETEVLGHSRWLRGGPASLRVIVSDHRTDKPLRADVSISLAQIVGSKPAGAATPLYTGRTNPEGTLDAQFRAPKSAPGAYQLQVAVDSPLGKDRVVQNIQLEQTQQILLTADKPVYQPGQTMHMRALALDMATRSPVNGDTLVFEVEDARGNKVFKKREKLTQFGVAAADFVLAHEVNMGTFTMRAVLPNGQAEKKVRVEGYVLPKFKIGITTDKTFYLPGETVKATVQADYFFGKPVSGGQVDVTVNTIDIGVTKLAEIAGRTDASGAYKLDYKLPDSFVGQPFEQGKAVAELQVRVKDTADHQQMQSKTLPVVKDPIIVVMVPESKQMVPGVPNRVFIACGSPDGAPVKDATLTVAAGDGGPATTLTTDALGLATYQFTPKAEQVTVTVQATSVEGNRAATAQTFTQAPGKDGVLLRTDKTIARVGEALHLTALSPVRTGTIYIDVIRNRQTIITRAETAENGQATLMLPVTNDMVGTCEVHAYKILPDENIVRDTRTVVVTPADDLTVNVTTDAKEYRPGADAVLRFAVRGKANQPVAAIIGLAIVDESVFALSELQPGLEKIYFMLERELMEPKYEIHGLRPTDVVLRKPQPESTEPQRQRAAAMLFAAAPPAPEFDYRTNTYLVRYQGMMEKVLTELMNAQQRIQRAAQKYQQDTGQALPAENGLQALVDRGYLNANDIRDPWKHMFRTEMYGRTTMDGYFTLASAGPDGRWGNLDDVRGAQYRFRGRGAFGGGGLGGGGRELDGVFMARRAGRDGGAELQEEMLALGVMADRAMPAAAPGGPGGPMGAAKAASGPAGAPEPRVRQFFPETMYWNPAVITDAQGRAELRVPVADSITTWRMSMLASGAQGQLGSATAPLKVFQDFFVDIDLPVSLTQNDRVEIPVAVYNYLPGDQSVTLELDGQDWFKLEGPARQTVKMGKNEVKVIHYPMTVNTLGQHRLKVTARGTKLSDAMVRSIEVTPDGKEVRQAINDRLDKEVRKTVTFPANAVPGANALWVKLYPGAFSQVVEGLDGLLRMPNGCFEQTSSTTYPNILVTDYLKGNKRINPELQMKAEQYINVGYQRLVTFEVKGGGFSWFGEAPAHQVLTAYGLLEFADMAKVHEVDPALISRTQQWLAGRQKDDGTWPEDAGGIAEGIINRQTGALRTAAYIAWTLAESGYKGPEVQRAVEYVKGHRSEVKDAYTYALMLNLFTKVDRDGAVTGEVANKLIEMAKQNDKAAWWEGDTQTFTGAKKESADLETTGLAAYGLTKWGRNGGFVNKVLTYLVQSKDSFGTWSTTQGTVWAMKSLLYAAGNGVGGGKGTVTVWANDAKAATFEITPEDSDVMRQADLQQWLKGDKVDVRLTYQGEGSLLYQIVSRHYLPWNAVANAPDQGPLSIDVVYDKKTLAQDDTARVTVTVKNNTNRIAEMPLLDIGVPPGFAVDSSELEEAVKAKRISRYTLAQRQVIVYVEKLDPGATLELKYSVKASYPVRARTPVSVAYPYYNPDEANYSAPQNILVRK